MRILLDSHTLIWWATDPERLIPSARTIIADPQNEIFASAVSIWELGLKVSKGKLELPSGFTEAIEANGIAPLPFNWRHASESLQLPEVHGDPFDRALLAQCRVESMALATRDRILPAYGVPIVPV